MSTWASDMAELAQSVEDAFGCHTITLTRRTPGSLSTTTLVRATTTATVSDVPCSRGEPTLIDDNGQSMTVVEYTIRAAAVGGVCPAKGDLVTEAAVPRTVVGVSIDAAGAIYRVRCSDRAATR